MTIRRYEKKYLLDYARYRALLAAIRPQLREDPHSAPEKGYTVTSLYYDTPGLDGYRDKQDGVARRTKLRIRVYGIETAPRDAYVEIKEKDGIAVAKRRIRTRLEPARRLCRGEVVPGLSAPDAAHASEVRYRVKRYALRPCCLVHYRRIAFCGTRFDPGLRVTFDRGTAYRVSGARLPVDFPLRPLVPAGRVILEIKFNRGFPAWLGALVRGHDLGAVRLGKYCLAMNAHSRRLERALSLRDSPRGGTLQAPPRKETDPVSAAFSSPSGGEGR
jgi:hypothetical protein